MTDPGALPAGYGASLLQSLLALGGVLLLVWVVLRALARHGPLGWRAPAAGVGPRALAVVDRLPLDARRVVWLVEVEGGRRLVLGTGEQGPPVVLAVLEHARDASTD